MFHAQNDVAGSFQYVDGHQVAWLRVVVSHSWVLRYLIKPFGTHSKHLAAARCSSSGTTKTADHQTGFASQIVPCRFAASAEDWPAQLNPVALDSAPYARDRGPHFLSSWCYASFRVHRCRSRNDSQSFQHLEAASWRQWLHVLEWSHLFYKNSSFELDLPKSSWCWMYWECWLPGYSSQQLWCSKQEISVLGLLPAALGARNSCDLHLPCRECQDRTHRMN